MGDSSTAAIEDCLRCFGTGELDNSGPGPTSDRECDACSGLGRIATVCTACHEPPEDDVHVVFEDCCEHAHADARNHAAYFAGFTPVGCMEGGDEMLLLANCPACKSTIARCVARGSEEHVAFVGRTA